MNELSNETSPYLLQHAQNPIYWKAWNSKTLQRAKKENKLIVLSVGYSACHWCHVMEHESFEDDEVAAVMNRHYISIKVDREERPDVDAVYMKAVQLMTGQGGWPMNVVLLPDGRPVWGGTFFRKDNWIAALQQLQDMFATDPEQMMEYALKLHTGVKAMVPAGNSQEGAIPHPDNMKPIVENWKRSFDLEYGGYARAPKFMMPDNYLFLQRYGYQAGDSEILEFTDLTLTRMAWGGLFDTVGGGFSRYSVDMQWHVPHFEKMLYDNGQLMSLYAQAYKRTKNALYKEVIEKTHAFVQRDLATPDGAFFSALDADSINLAGKLEEGAFYAWEKQELRKILGDDFELFAHLFNINDFGYWEDAKFVLIQNRSLKDIAKEQGVDEYDLYQRKQKWEQLLFEERSKRKPPRLDDKVITSWNALMLKGYADSYMALGDLQYLEAAEKNAYFICNTMRNVKGKLHRTYKGGTVKIDGFLEDYATTADAFLTLYQATANEKWLYLAKELTDYCLEHFYNPSQQFFAYNEINGEQLIAPHFETEDNVIPASNSIMANILYSLSLLFNDANYEKVALQMLYHILPSLDYPSAFSNWMNLWLSLAPQNKELAICGERADHALSEINKEYLPHVLKAGCTAPSEVPFLQNRFVKDSLMYYVCSNRTCNLPTSSADAVLNDLKL